MHCFWLEYRCGGFVPADWENCKALTLEASVKLWYLMQKKQCFTSLNNDQFCTSTPNSQVGVEGEESLQLLFNSTVKRSQWPQQWTTALLCLSPDGATLWTWIATSYISIYLKTCLWNQFGVFNTWSCCLPGAFPDATWAQSVQRQGYKTPPLSYCSPPLCFTLVGISLCLLQFLNLSAAAFSFTKRLNFSSFFNYQIAEIEFYKYCAKIWFGNCWESFTTHSLDL